MKKILKIILSIVILYFTYLLLLITLQYLPFNFNVSFLELKGNIITDTVHYKIAFFTHVYTSIFLVIIGLIQFWNHNKLDAFHKPLGMMYVIMILFLSAPSGLIMSFYANGGGGSKLSFVTLTLLWFIFTYLGYKYAKQKNWRKHQKMMLRSYSLTLSAITLRLFKWLIVSTIALPPIDTYKIVAWLGWSLNLFVVEVYIFIKFTKKGVEKPIPFK